MSYTVRSARIICSSLVLLVVGLLVLINETSAVTPYNRYVIKSRPIQLDEGLIILRRFLLPSLNDNDKCQSYSVLLYNYYKYDRLDQFRIAEIGVASSEKTLDEYKKLLGDIQRDVLRDLFKEAITKISKGKLDPTLLELVDCFSKKFATNDVRATSFLNNRELKNKLNQYRSILAQKLDFLLNERAKHPDLTIDRLDPSVRETVGEIFNGNQARADSRFTPGNEENHEEPAQQVETSSAYSAPAPASPAPQAHRVEPRIPVAQSPVDAPAQVSLPMANTGHITDQLPEENKILLNKAISMLDRLYKTLPLDSKLNDRCLAYSQVITSEPSKLNEQLVHRIVKETDLKIKTKGPSVEKYIPEANVRDNFLFTISAFPKASIGDETWMDLVDCVSQWENVDEQVRAFMNNPQHYYEELLASAASADKSHK